MRTSSLRLGPLFDLPSICRTVSPRRCSTRTMRTGRMENLPGGGSEHPQSPLHDAAAASPWRTHVAISYPKTRATGRLNVHEPPYSGVMEPAKPLAIEVLVGDRLGAVGVVGSPCDVEELVVFGLPWILEDGLEVERVIYFGYPACRLARFGIRDVAEEQLCAPTRCEPDRLDEVQLRLLRVL